MLANKQDTGLVYMLCDAIPITYLLKEEMKGKRLSDAHDSAGKCTAMMSLRTIVAQ